jgi:hypothetical protein
MSGRALMVGVALIAEGERVATKNAPALRPGGGVNDPGAFLADAAWAKWGPRRVAGVKAVGHAIDRDCEGHPHFAGEDRRVDGQWPPVSVVGAADLSGLDALVWFPGGEHGEQHKDWNQD